jgi:hypothetical protein
MQRLRLLLPAVWAGLLLTVALVATPSGFALLPAAEAGRLAGRILGQEAAVSLALAVVLLLLDRRRHWQAEALPAGAPPPRVLEADVLLVAGAAFCTIAGYYALLPLMDAARAGQGRFSFGQLHAASAVFYGLKLVLVLALAWRRAGRPAAVD